MSLVVVGVTGATMWVTQRRVQATYLKLFEEQFRAQIAFFSQRQVNRLQASAKIAAETVTSADLIAAMDQPVPDADAVYGALKTAFTTSFRNGAARAAAEAKDAASTGKRVSRRPLPFEFALPEGLGTEDRAEAPPGPPPGAPSLAPDPAPDKQDDPPAARPSGGRNGRTPLWARASAPLVRMLDAAGRVLTPPEEAAGEGGRYRFRQLQADRLVGYLRARNAKPVDQQETGYLVMETDKGQPQLHEFLITPVRRTDGTALGALIAATPVDFGERALYDFSSQTESGEIASGIWIDSQLYTETIEESERPDIAGQVVAALAAQETSGSFSVTDPGGQAVRVLYRVLNPDSPFGEAVHVSVFSQTDLLREQADLRLRIGGFGLVALSGAVLLIWLISHGLTLPMKELVSGTQAVGRGEFEIRVPVRTRDEVGQLANAFNEMAAGLEKGRRYQTVLAQVSDPHVAEELIRNPARLGGQLLTVSVLFCDIRGFTSLTAGMAPQEVIGLLNEHMSALTHVVQDCGGVVDKFAGDMIMALFGAPQSRGQDAENAARCALRMIAARRELNQRSAWQIEIGIGLATGEVVAGCMGSEDRLNYTVLGERVNLGSRLCGMARPGEIWIDGTTRETLGGAATATALDPVTLKGFAAPVPAWRLDALTDSTSRQG